MVLQALRGKDYPKAKRIYTYRTARGDLDHRAADRPVATRFAECP